jgi:hypothetical protein
VVLLGLVEKVNSQTSDYWRMAGMNSLWIQSGSATDVTLIGCVIDFFLVHRVVQPRLEQPLVDLIQGVNLVILL